MSDQDLRTSARSALLWLGGASIFRDVMQFGATILLARLLNPEVYGQAALGQTIIGFLAVFSFRSFVAFALQHRDPNLFDWRTHLRVGYTVNVIVFVVTNLASLLLWLLWASRFQSVSIVLSIMSMSFLLEPIAASRTTWLEAHHRWQRVRVVELSSALVSGAGGVALAFSGAGVLALAAMTPLQQLPAVVDFLFFRDRTARLQAATTADYRGAKAYSLNRLGSGIVATGVGVFEQSLMTSMFGFAALGLYNRALGLVNITSGRIGPLVVTSLYPVLTRAEAGSDRYRKFSGTLIRSIIAVVVPAAAFLVYEAQPLVEVLFGAKWIAAARYVPFAATYVTIGSMNLVLYQIMLANLQQKTCLRIDVGAAISRLAVAALVLPFGVMPFLFGLSLQGAAVLLASVEIARRTGSIEGWVSIKSVVPVSLAVAAAIGAAYLVPDPEGNTVRLAAGVVLNAIVFSITYVGILRLAAPTTIHDIIEGLPVGPAMRSRVRRFMLMRDA